MNRSLLVNSIVILGFIFSTCVQSESQHDWDWPYKRNNIEVMNNLSALQFYGPYPGFHHGLDLLANGQEKVYAPVSGKVGTRYYYKRKTPYTYEIFIELDDGYRIELHHIDMNTIPPEIEELAKVGGRIEKGRYLGTIYDSRKLGIPMHLHTNLKTPDGYYANPLQRYPRIVDKTSPVIEDVFSAVPTETAYMKIDQNMFGKHIDKDMFIFVRAYDLIGNSPNRLGLYKLEVFINKKTHKLIQFDQLPEKRFTKGADIYLAKSVSIDGNIVEPGEMNNITGRNFFYKILLPKEKLNKDEDLHIDVNAYDFNGNMKTRSFAMKK